MCCFFLYKNSLDNQTRFWVDREWKIPKCTFYSKIFPSLQEVHSEVYISVHTCWNNYLGCMKWEVHDHLQKHVVRCTKKQVPIFLILEAVYNWFRSFMIYKALPIFNHAHPIIIKVTFSFPKFAPAR